jgi:hypothetical protein
VKFGALSAITSPRRITLRRVPRSRLQEHEVGVTAGLEPVAVQMQRMRAVLGHGGEAGAHFG